jgi:hypothetical protein
MPSPEQPSEPPEPAEIYYQAARFLTERSAGRAYFTTQDELFKTECDVSSYHLQRNQRWHVAVIGAQPSEKLDQRFRLILAAGEPASLPTRCWLFWWSDELASRSEVPG